MKKAGVKKFFKNIYRSNKKFIIAMVVIIVLGNIGILLKNNAGSDDAATNDLPSGMEVEDFNAYLETLKDVPSDIEGYSVYDKYIMGLQRQDGSDSDYDGLTDKEEIEIYGTDPLKASTAGDLYTDYFKIAHNLDPKVYLEYSGEMEFPNNECPEVILTATCPTDFSAVVTDCTEKYSNLSSYGIKEAACRGYEIYNYSGSLSIDVQDLDDFDVYVGLGPFLVEGYSSFDKCEYVLDEDIASIDYDFDNHESYFVFLAKKNKFSFNGIINNFYNPEDKTDFSNLSGDDTAAAFVYGVPLFHYLGASAHVDYTECRDEDNTEIFLDETSAYVDEKVWGGGTLSKTYKAVNQATLEIKQGFFKKYLGIFQYVPGSKENKRWVFLFYWSTYKNAYSSQEENPYYKRVNTGFDKYVDELSFQNFESYIGTGGNCAGITHLTSYLYNTKSLPSSGSYVCNINGNLEKVEWTLGADQENATLMNPGLYDYKARDFVDNHSGAGDNYIGAGLSDGEMQFVNMIGCFWSEGNDRIDITRYELAQEEYYSVDLLNKILEKLDEGKVLDAYMYMRDGGGHAVNIYGYEWFDENALRLLIYDSNLPQDDRDGYVVDDVTNYCMMQVIIRTNPAGQEYIDYMYWPMTSNLNYMATSQKGLQQSHGLVIMDENWNVIY